MTSENPKTLPRWFWPLIAAAVIVGVVGTYGLLWIGVPDWFAVSLPILTTGLVGVALAYRDRQTRQAKTRK